MVHVGSLLENHFSHANILKYCPWNRPWDTSHEMNMALTEAWNSTVKEGNTVYFLGDFAMKHNVVEVVLPILNGRIRWISGNHDKIHSMHKGSEKTTAKLHTLVPNLEWVKDEEFIKIGKYRVRLNHFPYYEGSGAVDDYGYEVRYQEYRPVKSHEHFLLHGHRHSPPDKRLNVEEKSLDIGWDPWGRLLHIDEIEEIIRSVVG